MESAASWVCGTKRSHEPPLESRVVLVGVSVMVMVMVMVMVVVVMVGVFDLGMGVHVWTSFWG